MSIETIESLADKIAANAKTQKWLSCHFQVQTENGVFPVGVKAFGKWVQRIECCGMRGDVAETKTLRDLKAGFISQMHAIVRGL